MDFGTAIRTCFRQYATFRGRARRSEFWYFWLFLILGGMGSAIIDAALGLDSDGGGPVNSLFSLATFLPVIAVTARRLHDTGHSGWWQVAYVVPSAVLVVAVMAGEPVLMSLAAIALVVTAIMVLVWLVRAGDRGANRFGPDPVGPPLMAYPA